MRRIEALLAPSELSALASRDLSRSLCVVFDVLRATSSMIAALANGARCIVPVPDIPEALSEANRRANPVLAGERHGLRIGPELTGGRPFDLGNSPREFTRKRVDDREIIMTTTNGTRALHACRHSRWLFAASFGNLQATARAVELSGCEDVLLIASGTYEEAAFEDTLGIGALIARLVELPTPATLTDSSHVARIVWEHSQAEPLASMQNSRNARRVASISELAQDVAFCLAIDTADFAAEMYQGEIKRFR